MFVAVILLVCLFPPHYIFFYNRPPLMGKLSCRVKLLLELRLTDSLNDFTATPVGSGFDSPRALAVARPACGWRRTCRPVSLMRGIHHEEHTHNHTHLGECVCVCVQ